VVAIKGHFDGKVFVPDEPVDVPQNRPLILHVEVAGQDAAATAAEDLWATLDRHAGSVDAPSDWSAQHDHYLYGTPKRNDKDSE
jgi:hypothetical protein